MSLKTRSFPALFLPFCVLVLLVFPGAFASAQSASVSGRVTTASSSVVSGAQITLTSPSTKTTQHTTTNNSGFYTLPYVRPGTYSLTVDATGFERYERNNITIESTQSLALDISLQTNSNANSSSAPGVIQLAPLQVGGQMDDADKPYQMPGSSSFISQEQIDRFPGTSAGDLFKSTPGVIAATNYNGAGIDINIRGQQGMDRVKVTIDGTEQTTSIWRGYTGVSDQTYVDPDLIANIGIEKGPTTDAAGAGVTGGVVSFRTFSAPDIVKPGNTYGVRVRVGTNDNATHNARIDALNGTQATGGPNVFDFNNYTGTAIFAATQQNFDFIAGAAYRKSGNYFAGNNGPATYHNPSALIPLPLSYTEPGEETFNSSAETLSALTKTTFRFAEDKSIEFGYQRYHSKFGEVIGSVLSTQASTFRQLPLAGTDVDTYRTRYRWKPNSNLIDLKFNLWATDVTETASSVGPAFYLPPYITPQNHPPAHDMRFDRTWTYGGDISNTGHANSAIGKFQFAYGTSYTHEYTNGPPYISGRGYQSSVGATQYPGNGRRQIWSVFSSAAWDATRWLKLNGGLRYDGFAIHDNRKPVTISAEYTPTYPDKSGGRVNPSLGATVTPVQHLGLQFYALYLEGYRPPSLRESIGNDSLLQPNPNLKPEISRDWEFGINYLKDGVLFRKDKLRAKAAYFINNYDDYISRVQNTTSVAFFTTANLNKAKFSGAEFSGSYDARIFFAEGSMTMYTSLRFCPTAETCSSSAMVNDYALNELPPRIASSLMLGTHLFGERLSLATRIKHTGKDPGPLPVNLQQTYYWLPSTVVDAFASYKVMKDITFDLKAENLFDRYYIDALNGFMPSPGRTVRAVLTKRF